MVGEPDLVKAKYSGQLNPVLRRDGSAVSKIFPIIVLTGIAIILVIVTFTWNPSSERSDCQTPKVITSCELDDHNFTIVVEKIDPDPTSVVKVQFILLNESDDIVPGGQGSLYDIYGLDFSNETTNLSFRDNDLDGKISGGDTILIKHQDFGGLASEGYRLLLKFETTGDPMNGGGTRLG